MQKLFILLQYALPQHLLSKLAGIIANCRWSWLKNSLIRLFMYSYNIHLTESVGQKPEDFATFNDFFTRALKPQARLMIDQQGAIACPVDGYVSAIGHIEATQIFQAKGHSYSLQALLAGDAALAALFENGEFATLYLAPHNYHRVHMPYEGKLQQMTYVPGKLFSVNATTVAAVPDLFALNERVITLFETPAGPMAVILVGAMIVGSMETVWQTQIGGKSLQTWSYTDQNVQLQRGAEMGRFKLGSTVIVLFGKNRIRWQPQWQAQSELRLGQWLGDVL